MQIDERAQLSIRNYIPARIHSLQKGLDKVEAWAHSLQGVAPHRVVSTAIGQPLLGLNR